MNCPANNNNTRYLIKFVYCLLICVSLIIVTDQAAPADLDLEDNKSDEIIDHNQESFIRKSSSEHHINNNNDTMIIEKMGPPDSHEAMNNRNNDFAAIISSKLMMREKRSYEFLMGLINNNSKYEITKIDPMNGQQQQHETSTTPTTTITANKVAASELLLELMVKIAAHPDHWDKVHRLLETIDNDIVKSKRIVDELNAAKVQIVDINKQQQIDNNNNNNSSKIEIEKIEKKWPSSSSEYLLKNSYHPNKAFAYHRVTGRPLYFNKNPKAFIAVSVIAPKTINTRSGAASSLVANDASLENELRQLKPWTHQQNLKNMARMRSRWIIQSDDDVDDNIDNGETTPTTTTTLHHQAP